LHQNSSSRVFLVSLLVGWAVTACAQTLKFEVLPREVIKSRLEQYGGKDAQRESAIKQMFTEAGCDGSHLSEQPVKGSKLPNVICVLPGTGDKTIIVGAHFDHVEAGNGVVDNWSGASLLPSLFQAVKVQARKHAYIFVAFTDEERGEVGSKFYAQHMTATEIAETDAMVNMDTLALGPTAIWASHSDPPLISAIIYLSGLLNLPVERINVEQVGSTDSEQFAARKIPRVTLHSLTQESWNARILHSPKDNMSVVHFDDYYNSYRLIAGYLAFLDDYLPRPVAAK